jgi:hypothetical protein
MSRQKPGALRVPSVMTAVVVLTGTIFSFYWTSVTEHGTFRGYWWTPGDIWVTFRTASWIGWGGYGTLYDATGSYLTTPGIALLLTPFAMLAHALDLSSTFPWIIPHPTSWYILGPVSMLLGSSALFGFERLARQLGVDKRTRWILCFVEAALLWQVTILWGHPEDALALGLASYSMAAALDGRKLRSAWLLGAGIAFQPLVVLVLPLLIGRFGLRSAVGLISRAALPSLALLLLPFVENSRDTWVSVVEQPTQLALARATPWTRFAPVIAKSFVACGPTRLVAAAGALVIGLLILRRGGDWSSSTLIWCAGVCVALRFVMESAEEPYYIWPALALFVLASAPGHKARFLITCLLGLGLTVVANWRFAGSSVCWGVCVLGLSAMSLSSLGNREHDLGSRCVAAVTPAAQETADVGRAMAGSIGRDL